MVPPPASTKVLHVIQDFRCMRLDIVGKLFLRTARVRSLSGDINDSFVNDQRRDKSGAIGWLPVIAQFADTALLFGCGMGRATEQAGRAHAGE